MKPFVPSIEIDNRQWTSIYIDEQSFEELYNRYCRTVYSIALRIVRNTATAEEVTHEVFVLVWRHASRFDPSRGTFIAWITTLSRNKAIDQLRLKSERQDGGKIKTRLHFRCGCPRTKQVRMFIDKWRVFARPYIS